MTLRRIRTDGKRLIRSGFETRRETQPGTAGNSKWQLQNAAAENRWKHRSELLVKTKQAPPKSEAGFRFRKPRAVPVFAAHLRAFLQKITRLYYDRYQHNKVIYFTFISHVKLNLTLNIITDYL